MSVLWKTLLTLAVVLPLGGFIAGSLVTAAHDDPPPRLPIVLRDDTADPTPRTPRPERTDADDEDEHDDDHVVRPLPYDDDEDGEDSGNDDGDDGDDDGDDDTDDDGDD